MGSGGIMPCMLGKLKTVGYLQCRGTSPPDEEPLLPID